MQKRSPAGNSSGLDKELNNFHIYNKSEIWKLICDIFIQYKLFSNVLSLQ